jgi:hypothetical protein
MCQVESSANLSMHLQIYLEELSQVFFKKQNLYNKQLWWLSTFYSLCIQSVVRRSLLKYIEGTTKASIQCSNASLLGTKEYLHLPVRLFIASSGTHDPLIKEPPLNTNATSPQEEYQPQPEDHRDARCAVRSDIWRSRGITSSAQYLSSLFEDSGEALTTNNNQSDSGDSWSPVKSTAGKIRRKIGRISRRTASSSKSVPRGRTHSGTRSNEEAASRVKYHSGSLITDDEAASRVQSQMRRLPPSGKHEQNLRRLIEGSDSSDAQYLHSILAAADGVFFGGALSGRVLWDWSHPTQSRYETEIMGTTALRPAAQGGYETLIILSAPMLQDPDYDHRLLVSVFIHQMIHCYLFICCGFEARAQGGHSAGFNTIATIVDEWAGEGYLRLDICKASRNYFRKDGALLATETSTVASR